MSDSETQDISLVATTGRKQKNRKYHQKSLSQKSNERNQILVSLSLDGGPGEEAVKILILKMLETIVLVICLRSGI